MGSDPIKLTCPKCKKQDIVTMKVICVDCKEFMEPEYRED